MSTTFTQKTAINGQIMNRQLQHMHIAHQTKLGILSETVSDYNAAQISKNTFT